MLLEAVFGAPYAFFVPNFDGLEDAPNCLFGRALGDEAGPPSDRGPRGAEPGFDENFIYVLFENHHSIGIAIVLNVLCLVIKCN